MLVWHQLELAVLKETMPHLYDIAMISKQVFLDTESLKKKFSDAPSAELMHNVHVYEEGGKEMVEMGERFRLYPCWGGFMSKRVDTTKPLLGEYGWIGQACEFLCNRQNHARRDRRGLFSIHKKFGLLNRRPKKVSIFNFD